MTDYVAAPGSPVSGVTLLSGDTLLVKGGGVATNTMVASGGMFTVDLGGTASGTTVLSGASEFEAGMTTGTIVDSGAFEQIQYTGIATGATIAAGGEQDVFTGVTSSTTVQSGGLEMVYDGGKAVGTLVAAGGTLSADIGTTSLTVLQPGGTEDIGAGDAYGSAAANGTVVGMGAAQILSEGGSASGTVLQNGGLLLLFGGTETDPVSQGGQVVSAGVVDYDLAHGYRYLGLTASGDVLSSGEVQYVFGAGGLALGTVVQSGSDQIIMNGGVASGALDGNGGFVVVSAGGTASGAIVLAGGLLAVFSGTAIGTDVRLSGAAGELFGGTLSNTIVESGGLLGGVDGGEVDGTDIRSGGALAIIGATASGSVIENGGVEGVENAGFDSGAMVGSAADTLLKSGGYLVPLVGTAVTGTVSAGGTVVQSGVFVVNVYSGSVNYGDSATNLQISGGSLAYVQTDGVLTGGTVAGAFTLIEQAGAQGDVPSGVTVGPGGLATGVTFKDATTLEVVGSATGIVLTGSSSEDIDNGGFDSGVFIGAGTMQDVEAGGTGLGATVSSGGVQSIDVEDGMTTTVSGTRLLNGGELFFPFVQYASGSSSASYDPVTGVLTLTDNLAGTDQTDTRSVALAGDYSDVAFVTSGTTSADSEYGTYVTAEPACFCRGTLIATDCGEKPVEALAIGDLVVTSAGATRAIRWIGRRSYAGRFLAANPRMQPIRFRAGSLGDGLPRRDLLVSPEHAMFLDGVLVPAKLLVDGEAVVHETDLAVIDYFHVELDSHDVLLAEGAPSESFVDCDSRGVFQNAHSFTGAAPRWSFCAPRVEDGPVLARIRDRLRPRGSAAAPFVVRGHLDWVTHEGCAGWACAPDDPAATLEVEILVDGAVMVRVTANSWRPDVKANGIGTGRYGFDLAFAQPLPRYRTVAVTAQAVGGGDLVGAVQLEAATELDPACLPGLALALQARAATAEGAREVAGFLLDQLRAARTVQRRRGSGPLALVLDRAAPRPGEDAGAAAVTSHMQSLRRLGYQVVFVPLDNRAGPLPDGIGCAAWPEFPTVEDALRQHDDAALVYVHRVEGMSLYGGLIRRACPLARLIYAVADLHFLRLGRQAEVERSASRMAESRRCREQELAAAGLADLTLTHSAAEAELLRQLAPSASVGVVPWHVPCGPAPYAWRRRSGLVFVGGTAHAPNADALRWLASEIMPRVAKLNPRIRCKLVGAGLTEADRVWLHPAMEVLGPVQDLARVYRSARLAVAPLRFGAGVKGKVLEAFAAGLPCAMTPVAAEGLDLPGPLWPLVAQDADAFGLLVAALHDDPAANQAAGSAGRAFVASTASQQAVDEALANAAASARAPNLRANSRVAM